MNLYCPNYHIIPFPYIFPCLLYLQWFGIFWRIWSYLDYTDSFPYSNFSCQKSSVSLVFLLSTWLSGQRKKKRMIIQASIHTHKFFLLMSVISVQSSVVSYYLWAHGLQHSRLPCPSPTSGACSNSIKSVMPSNHLTLYHPLLLLPSIFPIIRVFPRSQFFASGSQSIRVSASASVLPMNIKGWFPLELTG